MANTHKRRKRRTKRKQSRVLRKRRPKKTTIRRRKMQRGGNTLDAINRNVRGVLGRAWDTFDTFRRKKKPSVPVYTHSATLPAQYLPGVSNLHQAVRELQQATQRHQQQIGTLIARQQSQPHTTMLTPAPRPTLPLSPHSAPSTFVPPSAHILPTSVTQSPSLGEHSRVQAPLSSIPEQRSPDEPTSLSPYRPTASMPSLPTTSSHFALPSPAVPLTGHLGQTYPARPLPSLARYPSPDTSEPYRSSLQRYPSNEPA